jgi:hypothetical protein
VEKSQFELCIETLRRFNKSGILDEFILIGSWCTLFYREFYPDSTVSTLKTRDIDILINSPSKIKHNVDIPKILNALGYIESIDSNGYLKLIHPELIIEFLVPEKGKGSEKPYNIPKLGINAVALRYLSLLSENIIKIKIDNFYINLPHPVNFAFHKIIISNKRKIKEKVQKDLITAQQILNDFIKNGDEKTIKDVYSTLFPKWKKKILSSLNNTNNITLINLLENI